MVKRKRTTQQQRPRKRRRRSRRQKGHGFDIQKKLAKTGIEFHWPGMQYTGPGTHLEKRLKRGDPGKNRLDRIAKQHDIDYSKAKNIRDKWKADDKIISAINQLPGKKNHPRKSCKKNYASQEKVEIVIFLLRTFFNRLH